MPRTAAALVVGNEILTGKIADTNTPFLARELFSLGIELRRVVVCPDEVEIIARDVNELRAGHDFLFTSGGVGPTHDDITLDAVAHAFEVPLVQSQEMAEKIRAHFAERTTDAHLRMANIPAGGRLIRSAELRWPTVQMENIFVLPGVPSIFEAKLKALRPHLDIGEGFHNRTVLTQSDEGEIAALLATIAARFPAVMVGCYLGPPAGRYKTKVTFDGPNPQAVDDAASMLREELHLD